MNAKDRSVQGTCVPKLIMHRIIPKVLYPPIVAVMAELNHPSIVDRDCISNENSRKILITLYYCDGCSFPHKIAEVSDTSTYPQYHNSRY
jgi:hypothetical protein